MSTMSATMFGQIFLDIMREPTKKVLEDVMNHPEKKGKIDYKTYKKGENDEQIRRCK